MKCFIYLNKTEWSIARALKWSIFIVQKLALHENTVEFRQQFNSAIRTSLSAPNDGVHRRKIDLYSRTHALTNEVNPRARYLSSSRSNQIHYYQTEKYGTKTYQKIKFYGNSRHS